ncbi:TetR/AcrR family transcriptional regulator [Micromonospora costi]|uniref:TetR/AcrR family transcriptional regulator n=1 Tax=Micromonospora costi TaxID=1530042 RepID=A0A3A9ZTN4_9ACTN|nr:TetR/AcrR family transcriptional regulator [Micromonospora costi]RKN51609.1 TetR/AcrR family transcriptional regulator [Micromonospora costi]
MTSRAESAAASRRALIDAATDLLDLGGLEAVTMRAVGARAGMTRGAPYRHFPDKEGLLIAVGTQAWDRLEKQVRALRADSSLSPAEKLRGVLTALITIGRSQPHLYQLMFSNPTGDPDAMVRAGQRSHDEFLAIVAALVGEHDAGRYGALLIGSAAGITGMEVDGQLGDKWGTSAEELVDTLVAMVANSR